MQRKTKPARLVWTCFLAIAIVSLACNLPVGESRKLALNAPAQDGVVSGQYQGADGQLIEFEVTIDGMAIFRAANAPIEESVTVQLNDPEIANMTWGGSTFDGRGILKDEEQAALGNLMKSELANGMAMIPLDIACLGDELIDPQQLAALLFPLQMHFKYLVSDRGAEAERLMDLSECDYRNLSENTPQLLFAPSIPIPVVFGYFPFDESGAIEELTSIKSGTKTACLDSSPAMLAGKSLSLNPEVGNQGPCNAMCRGACGADCARSNCDYREEKRCELDEDGKNTGVEITYQVYDCGLHQGCIDHDACYDACNEQWGCDSYYAAFCRHAGPSGCDQAAIDQHGLQNTSAWAYGYGPQPMRETFEYEETWTKEFNARKCPPDAILNETPKIEIVIIPVGTYSGETNFKSTLENDIDNSYLPPVCKENTVRIVIDSDGTAQGELRSICYSNRDTDNPEMRTTHHSEVSGMIKGQMEGDSGQLTITYKWRSYFTSPQWETTSLDETVEFVFPYHANMLENMMTLTPAADVEDYYSYKLYRE